PSPLTASPPAPRPHASFIALGRPSTVTSLRVRSVTLSSGTARNAHVRCSPTPTSTNSLPTKPERTFSVRLQEPRRPLAVFPLRLPSARSSVSRLYEADDPARSRKSRDRRAQACQAYRRASRASADLAQARRRRRSLLAGARAALRGRGEYLEESRLAAGLSRQGPADHRHQQR